MKKIVALVVVSLVLGPLGIQNASALNLKQKKAKAKTEKRLADYSKKIEKKCGCTPKLEINWEELKTKDDFRIPVRSMSAAADAMASLCKNFKKEVCGGVKTISLKRGKLEKSFNNGTLTLGRVKPNEGWSSSQIQKMLEEKL